MMLSSVTSARNKNRRVQIVVCCGLTLCAGLLFIVKHPYSNKTDLQKASAVERLGQMQDLELVLAQEVLKTRNIKNAVRNVSRGPDVKLLRDRSSGIPVLINPSTDVWLGNHDQSPESVFLLVVQMRVGKDEVWYAKTASSGGILIEKASELPSWFDTAISIANLDNGPY